jgi:hypothetical protein
MYGGNARLFRTKAVLTEVGEITSWCLAPQGREMREQVDLEQQ